MKAILLISFILIVAVAAFAQDECRIGLAGAPPLLNLKLGMSVDEVNAVTGRDLKVRVKRKGERTFFKNYLKKRGKGSLADIRAIFLSFFDGRLYQIELFYQSDYRVRQLSDLISEFESESGFPAGYWKVKYGYAKALCEWFSLDADVILNLHIQLTDDAVARKVKLERKAGK